MKHDHIEIDGKNYRIEFNWNAISDFCRREGLILSNLDDLAKCTPAQITTLIHAGIAEGCRLEKVEFPYSELDLGAMLNPASIRDITTIYTRHVQAEGLAVHAKKK